MVSWLDIRNALLNGKPVLIFDSIEREAETDMVFYAGIIDYKKIAYLRKYAGGQICFVSGGLFREALDLPFLQDLIIKYPSIRVLATRKPRYGDPPAFNIWLNHIATKTGISDYDKALTIKTLSEIASLIYKGYMEEARDRFLKEFYAPGHVPVLTSRGLANRRGHTELSVALSLITGLTPSMVIAEMLDEGQSLSYEDAKRFATRNGLFFIDGVDIVAEAEKRGFLND
ncbi:3,4-dihydroxy-2-butanone-4-phosphate synthase [Staphylothermus hellenicus]|uniref:34-dihydroxy-2-butanone 4-phosphate synthase n=1 Tax=Staphylothermus hellenicus (strain DSM 12710 / JCM 10830 / BK20S6-10-b1 / P8) TaxID=591019 RepID=D7DB99_STAHD|nr:3,4-dihydroxy-2-butanone-4-phosphate synthase [Staphylothermus hellenicus]ADI31446.1 34-dihydroxy-2-butanone 4-phosphate synthase [Staphylothermus hellenicus DSM 12710]